MQAGQQLPASFRDPSGFLFRRGEALYRQVNTLYREHYDTLMASGLYDHLAGAGLLIPHEETSPENALTEDAYRVLRPEVVPLVSYPYEWSFGQLKDTALLTLDIQKRALKFGMTLKDSSAYNVQFVRGKPVLIDSLSFELYREGRVWVPYRQYCQHFLAPLSLMSYRDVRLGQMLRLYIDGLPLDLVASLLPRRTRLRPGLLAHIHLHARSQQRYAGRELETDLARRTMSRQALLGLIDSLERTTRNLTWNPAQTTWAGYYGGDSYDEEGFGHKAALVGEYLGQAAPASVWDLGANTGFFARIASEQGTPTIAWDVDAGAVELNYRQVMTNGETHVLPLVLDLTNPSPGLGWANEERDGFLQRGQPGAVLALALIHHLAIANNVPLPDIARLLARLGEWLVVEFVPKSDPKVKMLLAAREDIFPTYTRDGFEAAFGGQFSTVRAEDIANSDRRLYLMRRSKAGPRA